MGKEKFQDNVQAYLCNRKALDITDYEFLQAFKDNGEIVFFRYINEVSGVSKNESCQLSQNEDEYPYVQTVFNRNQRKGYGIYFVVNSGGQKKSTINKITAHFSDLDFRKYTTGEKDENGKLKVSYRTDEEVEELKVKCLLGLKEFSLDPSIIVETKNGLHIYWLLNVKVPQDIKKFKALQLAIVKYFNNILENEFADPAVIDLSRVMRIINYDHLKNPQEPFKIKCLKFDKNLKYTQKDIAEAVEVDFNTLVPEEIEERTKNQIEIKSQQKEIKNMKISVANAINPSENTLEGYKEVAEIYNYADLFDYLKKQDLAEFLGVKASIGENFNCLYHKDNNPSANISKTSQGYQKYFCYSSNCSYRSYRGLDIIDIVMKQRECGFDKALEYLIQHYNIKFTKTVWAKKQQEKYIINLTLISSNKEREAMRDKYRNVNHMLQYALPYLRMMIDIGLVNIKTEAFAYKNESLFYVSNRFLAKEIGKDNIGNVNKYINLLCTLGLVEKINEEHVPGVLLQRAEEEREKNNRQDRICFYIIPNIYDVLEEAERRAATMLEVGFSIKSMGKKYLISVFGSEFADKIYGYQLALDKTEERRRKIEKLLLEDLKKIGYYSFERLKGKKLLLAKRTREDGTTGKIYMSELEKKIDFKIVSPRLIKKYNLIKKKANKELKDKFKLKGYYEIIYSERGTIV